MHPKPRCSPTPPTSCRASVRACPSPSRRTAGRRSPRSSTTSSWGTPSCGATRAGTLRTRPLLANSSDDKCSLPPTAAPSRLRFPVRHGPNCPPGPLSGCRHPRSKTTQRNAITTTGAAPPRAPPTRAAARTRTCRRMGATRSSTSASMKGCGSLARRRRCVFLGGGWWAWLVGVCLLQQA